MDEVLYLLGELQEGRSRLRWRRSFTETWCGVVGAHHIAIARAGFRGWRWKGNLSDELGNLVR